MKIGNRSVKIGDKWFDVEVHYDKKHSCFTVKNGLPPDFSTYSKAWRDYYGSPTEKGLLDHVRECINEYIESKTSSRKVIAFMALASNEITMNKVSEGHYSGFKTKKLGNLRMTGSSLTYELGFDFGVFTEVDKAGEKLYYKHKESGEISQYASKLGKNWIIIPFSDDSILFFKNLADNFQKMVHQLSEFFGEEDEQKVISFIQSHPKLLS